MALVLIVLGAAIFSIASLQMNPPPALDSTRFGITFSTLYAKELNLDPLETYHALVEDLGVRSVRLPIYWSDVEREQGVFDWTLYDELIRFSEEQNVLLTIQVGTKSPRWPECFVPDWAEGSDEMHEQNNARTFIQAVVERYRSSSSLERWQVENEPMFPFGHCSYQMSWEELQKRVELVRSLDTHPIQLTVSGELGPWKRTAQTGDVLGLSMYRKTYNSFFGYFVYPMGPEYYKLRSWLMQDDVEKVIVSELQAEPWFANPISTYSTQEAYTLFSDEAFRSNLAFVKQSGISEAYLWGAEWWYLLNKQGEDRLWNVAKTVFETK